MARFRKKLKNSIIYGFIKAVIWIFSAIPRGAAIFIGSVLGWIASWIYRKDRYKAYRHLEIAFDDKLSEKEKKDIVRRMFINFGKNFVDVVRMKNYYRSELRPLMEVKGIEHFDTVYKRGNGVIAVTGHIGNFELLAAFVAGEGYKTAAIGREIYDKRLNRLLVDNREAVGLVNVGTKDSPRRILELIKDGHTLGVLIDTDSFRVRSKMIPAFGRLSNTPVGQSVIGLKTGAGFVPGACVRVGNRYRVIFKPEVTITRTDDFEADVYNITKKCTEAIEQIITDYKDQWIWIHNRWHTRVESTNDETD